MRLWRLLGWKIFSDLHGPRTGSERGWWPVRCRARAPQAPTVGERDRGAAKGTAVGSGCLRRRGGAPARLRRAGARPRVVAAGATSAVRRVPAPALMRLARARPDPRRHHPGGPLDPGRRVASVLIVAGQRRSGRLQRGRGRIVIAPRGSITTAPDLWPLQVRIEHPASVDSRDTQASCHAVPSARARRRAGEGAMKAPGL